MNIGIIGCGYVGVSNAVLLAHQENIKLWDINFEKMQNFSRRILPFSDKELLKVWENINKNIDIAKSLKELVRKSQLILIALPTDYNRESSGLFVKSC